MQCHLEKKELEAAATADQKQPKLGPRRFAWHITELAVKSGSKGPRDKLLQNIRGYADTGTLTAILGPSGAGKSTLLDCLALRNRDFLGTLTLDGLPFVGPFGSMAAYVYQTDLCFANLTVREHLVFQAHNRLGGSMTADECERRVDEVIRSVYLELVAHCVIGGSIHGFRVGGISGGERKRLNIASELLSDPAILFVDEPTSGLDVNVAEAVCLGLRELAKDADRIVIAAIHTPSSNVFACFTHLTVLSWDGRLTYMGTREQMLSSLEGLGFQCPTYFNPADFILKLSSRRVIDNVCEKIEGYHKSGASDGDYQRLVAAYSVHPSIAQLAAPPAAIGGSEVVCGKKAAVSASMWTLFWANLQRNWIHQTRDKLGILYLRIAMDIMNGVLLGLAHRGLVGHSATHRSILSLNLFTVAFNTSKALADGIIYMPDELQILVREYSTSSNAAVPYYLAASIMAIFFSTIQLCCCIPVVYLISGHVMPPHALMTEVATHFFNHCTAYWLGFIVTAASPSSVYASSLGCLAVGIMTLFDGIGLEVSRLPRLTRWLSDISFLRHATAILALTHVSTIGTEWERTLLFNMLEVAPNELFVYQRRLMLSALSLWVIGLVALMVRVRVAKAV